MWSADARSSCFSSSRSLGPAPQTPDPLKTVYCTSCLLNVYLGKASNPNHGLGRSWFRKSLVLNRCLQTEGGGKVGETQSCNISGWGDSPKLGEGEVKNPVLTFGLTMCYCYTGSGTNKPLFMSW